ncbi:23_t:CDS:2, partial [Gigaspora rosea]
GKSNNEKLNFAGPGFKSAFIYLYNRQHSIFYQEVEFNESKITIYTEGNKFSGYQLFGLDNQYVQNLNQYIHVPTCSLTDWTNEHLMTLKAYIMSDRENRAWESLLRHVGCVEITLFEKNESE